VTINLVGVDKHFDRKGRQIDVLSDVNLTLGDHEFVSIVGTSGCGKSTLLSIVAGLIPASSGEVTMDGATIHGPARNRGLIVQSYTLFPWLTARSNIEFALREAGIPRREFSARSTEALQAVDLAGFGDAYPAELSGGMRQRVAIARTLAYRPSVLLMDEPFGALDALTRRLMQEFLARIWEQERLTVLFVTHDIAEAVFLSDRILVMASKPGPMKDEIAVPLARPRTAATTTEAEFVRIQQDVFNSIRQEWERIERPSQR
jgi:NitT/TauT family transport system ATP-binding protein